MRCSKFIFLICFILAGFFTKAQDGTLTIIAHSKGAPSEMKFNALKSVLKGEKERWPDGSKVVIALMKSNTSIGSTTSQKIYNMTADELNKYWLALVFQGKGHAPVFFTSTTDLENFISQTPGAIGVTGVSSGATRNILVEGKKTL